MEDSLYAIFRYKEVTRSLLHHPHSLPRHPPWFPGGLWHRYRPPWFQTASAVNVNYGGFLVRNLSVWGSDPLRNRREQTFDICSCNWSRPTLHVSNGEAPHNIQKGKLLRNGLLLLWFQLYHAGANEIKIGVRMVESLCGYILKPNITWFQTQTPNNGQWSISSTEGLFHRKIHELSIGTLVLSQNKFCRTGHQNISRENISPDYHQWTYTSIFIYGIASCPKQKSIKVAPTVIWCSSLPQPDWL